MQALYDGQFSQVVFPDGENRATLACGTQVAGRSSRDAGCEADDDATDGAGADTDADAHDSAVAAKSRLKLSAVQNGVALTRLAVICTIFNRLQSQY